MKKLLFTRLLAFLLFLLMFSTSYSQSYSEKWSEAFSRYEYRDRSGNLVGYKKWSTINQRWEYTEVATTTRKSYQASEPVSYGDTDLDYKILMQKQSNYDHNLREINQTYNAIQGWIDTFSSEYSSEDIMYLRNDMKNAYNAVMRNRDISYSDNKNYVQNYLWGSFDKKLCERLNFCNFLASVRDYLKGR